MNFDDIFQKYKLPLIFALFGLIFLGAGILVFKIFFSDQPTVKISEISRELPPKIFIDIQGAVQKPGLYELSFGSRVNDLLVVSGGLSAKADRVWVSRNINLAQKLQDGVKIYIPTQGETKGEISEISSMSKELGKININTASQSQLESLWGVGSVTAQKIIENRPYQKTEELLSKKIVKSNVWQAIKDKITVFQ